MPRAKTVTKADAPASYTLDTLLTGFVLDLQSTNRSPKTIRVYTDAVRILESFLRERGKHAGIRSITRSQLQELMVELLARNKETTAHNRFRALRVFFRWAAREGYVAKNPMADMEAPKLPEKLVPVFTIEELKRLVAACEGTVFDDRRDMAVMRLLIDTGMRREEIASLHVSDVDLSGRTAVVTGKGNRERRVKFGPKAAGALYRYTLARTMHPNADDPALWLGLAGPMTAWGIADLVKRRAAAAGVENANLHRFRHSAAHYWLLNGGQEGDLMELMGWTSNQMCYHYGKSAKSERARQSHQFFSVGEQI